MAIASGCFIGAAHGSRLQGRDTQLGLRAVLLTNGLWLIFQALGLLTTDELLSNALYIGGLIWGLTGVGAWVYFVSAYTGRSYHLNRRYRGLAVSVYLGLLVVKLTNPLYGLYVSTQLQQTPYPHLVVEPELFYWVSFSLTYALVAISFYWLVQTLRESSSPTIGLGALAVLSLFPVVPRVAIQALPAESLPPIMLGLSFEPVGVTAFLLGVLVFVGEPFRQVEQSARSKFFEEADDATYVYGTDGRLVEMNRRADKLEATLGVDCQTVDAFEQAFRPVDNEADTDTVTVELDGETRFFDVTVNQMGVGAERVGVVASVRDITERIERKRDLELKERAMDEANVGIQITDPTQEDNPLIYVNDGFERMTGYTRADALGRNPRFLQGEEGDSEEVAQLREAIRTEEPISLELQNERNDGELFWSRLSVTPVTDESGAVKNYIGIQQDVTDRKKRERRTEARNEFLKRIYEVTTDPDLTFERKITDLLEAGREHLDLPYGFLTQIERDDEQGTGSRTIVEALGSHELLQPGESAPLEQSYCRETMEQGGIMALTRATEAGLSEDSAFETFGLETYIASEVVAGDDPYGTLCFASDTARDRPFDEFERSVIQLAGRWAGYEIDRQNTREALQEERERLGLTLSGTNTGLAEWDVETDEVTWNETLTEILGRDIKSVEEFGAAIHPDDRAQVQQQLDAMVETGETWTGEFRMFDDSDDTLWMGTRATAVYDDEGEPVRVLATGTDVTDRKRRQQKLFEERERFRLLTESVDEYAFIGVDEDGVIQTWNESAEGTFGYDAESATGLSIAELHPEANRERGLPDRLLQQAKVAGESAHEGWRVREDGSKFYADVRYAPLTTTDGEFDGYATIVRDMTNRRRERRRTERFVEESDDVVTIVDPDGTVTYASGSASRVLGYEPDDLVGENLFDHVHPDGRERAMNAFFSCVKESEKVETECRFDSPDEGWINIDGRCRNMLDDDAVNGVLVYLRDVTETRERNRRFEGIFNSTFGLTGLLKPDGTVVEVNDAALEFGGVQRDEVVGESFSDAPWWTQSEVVRSDVREAVDQVADGDFVRYEAEVRGADGLATIDFSVKPVTDEDDNVSLLVFEGRDITALQRHKRHLEVMQRVMRHNMRNDITKLRGWTEMMREEPDAEKRAEQFDTVDQIFDKWVAMTEKTKQIRTVLDSQRGQDVHLEPETLVEEAVAPVREEYTDCSVVTHVPDADVQVPATLLDAVRELVENAAKVTQDPAIEVEVGRSADGWTEVSVRDDGPGMPDMEADVLENGKETPLNHGQGLGLWMVRMIVTQAGGDAVVTSTNGGTDICLRLPGEQTIKNRLSGKAA